MPWVSLPDRCLAQLEITWYCLPTTKGQKHERKRAWRGYFRIMCFQGRMRMPPNLTRRSGERPFDSYAQYYLHSKVCRSLVNSTEPGNLIDNFQVKSRPATGAAAFGYTDTTMTSMGFFTYVARQIPALRLREVHYAKGHQGRLGSSRAALPCPERLLSWTVGLRRAGDAAGERR